MSVLLVAAGGALGSVLRWQLARFNGRWPIGTLAANGLGTLVAGVVLAVTDDVTATVLLVAGVAGGLTTFSTLAVEIVRRPPRLAAAYLVGTVVVGSAAMALGMVLT